MAQPIPNPAAQPAVSAQQTEQLLCRTIIRLTLATSGLDSTLDPHLTKLRDAVRRGMRPGVHEKLTLLSEQLIHADKLTAGSQQEGDGSDLFQRLLGCAKVKGATAKRLCKLARQMQADPQKVSDAQLDALLQLLVSDATAKADTPGLFGRLFSRAERQERSPAQREDPNRLLLGLLERLNWPGQLGQDISRLQGQLAGADADDSWVEVIKQLAQLVSAALTEVHTEMHQAKDFLQQLNSRLGDLDLLVNGSAGERQESLVQGRQLNQSVQQRVGGIRQSISSAASIQQIQQEIARHLDAIQSNVDAHVQAEAGRHDRAEKREEELQQRLQQIESESNALRQKMIDAHQQATTDAVTGLPNRMAYEERMAQEFARWRRFGQSLSVIMWDVDDFKKINDRFGHQSGDKALRVIAQTIRRRLRETDFVARYGGEEFVMLLAGASTGEAQQFADEIRQAVADSGFHSAERKISVTVSCGIAEFRQDDTPDLVFNRADQALYRAKHEGKNRCIAD